MTTSNYLGYVTKKRRPMVAFLNVNGGTEIQWNAERNPPQRFITQSKYRDKMADVIR